MSLTKDSASKILQAKLHKDLATVRGERKFPSRPLEFISPLKVVAKGSDVAVGTGYLERIITGWGVFSVLAILGNAIKRVIPIALQPFLQKDLTLFQWGAYITWALYMTYAEGYKAFQTKFSPLIVRRAVDLNERRTFLNIVLAGPYCMGLFGATKKRMIVSWSVSAGVLAVVHVVKKLPYPWRSIVDGGVVCGLTYGALSICWLYAKSFWGIVPDIDPCHNDDKRSPKSTQ